MDDHRYIRDISLSRISDAEEAGGKGANMGELVAAKLPLPPLRSLRTATATPCGRATSTRSSAGFIGRR